VPPALSLLTSRRDFRYLFLAQIVMFGGDWFALIPLISLLQSLTGSGLPGAIALAADTTVGAVVLPFAGVLADRMNRRTLMVVANCGTIVAVGLLFGVHSASTAWLGPVAIGLAAMAKSLYSPAASAALPNVVRPQELATANAVAGSTWGVMAVVAASLGGVLSQVLSPYACFAIDLGCLAVAALLVLLIRRPLQAAREGAERRVARPVRDVVEALRFIRQRPRVASLVTVKSAVGLGNGVLAIYPVLAATVFGLGSTATGLLFAARGLGALVGPFLFARILARRELLMPGLALSMLAYGAAYLVIAVTPWFWLVLVVVAFAHLAGGGNWVMSNYALQVEVPDALRGRVAATDLMIVSVAISASMLVSGALVDHVGARWVLALCGGLTLVYGVCWRLVTRRLLRGTAALAPEPAV
jgi:MFS family permease